MMTLTYDERRKRVDTLQPEGQLRWAAYLLERARRTGNDERTA